MAGLKVWADPEILYSADINTYLMGQAIPRFASTAARDAAITAPAEGMFAYITGAGAAGLTRYTGSVWKRALPLVGSFTITFVSGVATGTVPFGYTFNAAPTVELSGAAATGNTPVLISTSSVGTTSFDYVAWPGSGTSSYSGTVTGRFVAFE
jgi:hypothetical protein